MCYLRTYPEPINKFHSVANVDDGNLCVLIIIEQVANFGILFEQGTFCFNK